MKRLQPWRYYFEVISNQTVFDDIEVYAISSEPNLTTEEWKNMDGISIYAVPEINPLGRDKSRLRDYFSELDPDIVVWPVDQFTFLYRNIISELESKVVGVCPGIWYDFDLIRNTTVSELIRNIDETAIPLLMSIVPDWLESRSFRGEYFDKIITFSEDTRKTLIRQRFSENLSKSIPPGLSSDDFHQPSAEVLRKARKKGKSSQEDFTVLYMGSPLSIRGLDTTIDAVKYASKEINNLNCIVLSRRHTDPETGEVHYADHEEWIKEYCSKNQVQDIVSIVPGFLSREEVRSFISISDAVCLPFKTLQADMPLSILEVLALGRIPISTTVGGIPELVQGENRRGYAIEPNSPEQLASRLVDLHSDNQLRESIQSNAKNYAFECHPTWVEVSKEFYSFCLE